MVDCATLTGAAVVALGDEITAVFGNDRDVVGQILEAGRKAGEPSWELPLYEEYRKGIESPIADVKNIGPRGGGAITAALFLREFVGDTPWVHMDVAGSAFSENGPGDYWPRGATGNPTRTLVQWILDRSDTRRAARSAGNGSSPGSRKAPARKAAPKRSAAKRYAAKRSGSARVAKKATARRASARRR